MARKDAAYASLSTSRYEIAPRGPFDLENQVRRFGGWPKHADAIVMTFPVEGWTSAVAVVMRQNERTISGEIHKATGTEAERAWRQALAAISLDVDGSGFRDVGRRDPVIGRLQAEYHDLRPVLFHSPYEAASAFVIGHRITIAQTRRIRQRLAEEAGTAITVGAETYYAFPDPRALLRLDGFAGVASAKIERLHALRKRHSRVDSTGIGFARCPRRMRWSSSGHFPESVSSLPRGS